VAGAEVGFQVQERAASFGGRRVGDLEGSEKKKRIVDTGGNEHVRIFGGDGCCRRCGYSRIRAVR